MTDDDNKNRNPDFEDDIFDESYYEDDAVYDEADLSVEDSDFDDVDFDEADWNEEEEAPLAGKRNKSLYRSEKKPFLSFNTIVIIGAFIVGAGVLAFTVMGQSAKVSSGIVPKFISSLNIADVMDGGIFGPDEKQGDDPEAQQSSEAGDQSAVQETGFLDDPEGFELQATGNDELPPQPTPISPAETQDVLTPMPQTSQTETAQQGGNIPRAPDAMISATGEDMALEDEVEQTVPQQKTEEAQPSAEDILKRALANRGQKQQDEVVATEVPENNDGPVVEEVAPVPPAPKIEPVTTVAKAPVTEISTPVPSATPSASQDSVKNLEAKLDTILKRMEKIETELNSVRDGREGEYESLQKTVTSLRGDITALKNAPAPKAAPVAKTTETEAKAALKKPAKKAAPAPKREEPAYSPPKPAVQPAQSASWELRAAQPGKAWVSKAGQRDMQGVVVGDTVPGIGRVTAISYQNGRWIVTGTQGQIRQ